MKTFLRVGWMAIAACAIGAAFAQTDDDKDKNKKADVSQVVVTAAMRVQQGGAKDINFFRDKVARSLIPHPNEITAEGLFGEHDILLAQGEPCRQLFCLTGEAMRADLIAQPEAEYLVGVGFTSNIDEKKWHRAPLNLVAVVDKSGSMDGTPLELVRQSLLTILGQLKDDDQLSIVLYGDTAAVFMAPTRVTASKRSEIATTIRHIESEGSTSMEAGLTVGYQVADESAPAFKGRTRLMLFTDERPNTDATDAESFMGMATKASERGIGLTTIGVGIQFGAELAARIGSVRGGNLYFIRDKKDVDTVYKDQLDYMVSELAHDLHLTLSPPHGMRIAGVFGIPGRLVGWQNKMTVEVTVPTVFLSNRGGGIFFTLARDPESAFVPVQAGFAGEKLASVGVSYLPVGKTKVERHAVDIEGVSAAASPGMMLGRMLVDEFTAIHRATSAHYLENDQEKAYQLMRRLDQRMQASHDERLASERELVSSLDAQFTFLSGHGSEALAKRGYMKLWGRWRVVESNDSHAFGYMDLAEAGRVIEFGTDSRIGDGTPVQTAETAEEGDEEQGDPRPMYEATDRRVSLKDQDVAYDYKVDGNRLILTRAADDIVVKLERVPDAKR